MMPPSENFLKLVLYLAAWNQSSVKHNNSQWYIMLRIFDFQPERVGSYHVLRDDIIAGGTKHGGRSIYFSKTSQTKTYITQARPWDMARLRLRTPAPMREKWHIYLSAAGKNKTASKTSHGPVQVYVQPPPSSVLYGMTQNRRRNHNGISLPPAFDTPAFEAALVESLKDFDIRSLFRNMDVRGNRYTHPRPATRFSSSNV